MKKFIKSILSLSLAANLLTTSAFVLAEEAVEEVEETEVVEEAEGEAAEGEGEEAAEEAPSEEEIEAQFAPVENPEEIYALINEANQEAMNKSNSGYGQLSFAGEQGGIVVAAIDYLIEYNLAPRLSMSIDASWLTPDNPETPENLIAYIHNGVFLQYNVAEEVWNTDDFTPMEETLTEMLSASSDDAAFREKHFNVLESETNYLLQLKTDVNAEEFYADLDAKFDFETLKELIKANSAEQENSEVINAVVDKIFSQEKLTEILANDSRIEYLYAKDTGYLVNTFTNLNIPVADFYAELGVEAEEIPSTLILLLEQSYSDHGTEFDFSHLDEVAPAE